MDPVIILTVSSSFAILWLVAGAQKLAAFGRFSVTLADYRLVPKPTVRACAGGVIALEIGLGVALFFPATRSLALVGSAALLLVYAAAIGINLLRGRKHIDCGCMGPTGRQTLSSWLVARNTLLVLAALASSVPAGSRALVWLDALSIAAAVGVASLLYCAVNYLIANTPDLARLRD